MTGDHHVSDVTTLIIATSMSNWYVKATNDIFYRTTQSDGNVVSCCCFKDSDYKC